MYLFLFALLSNAKDSILSPLFEVSKIFHLNVFWKCLHISA